VGGRREALNAHGNTEVLSHSLLLL